MINTITAAGYPEIWDEIFEDSVENSYREHRRGSNFYTKTIYVIAEQFMPHFPRELDGYWETEVYVDDSEYGSDDDLKVLHRVEKETSYTLTEKWVKVEEGKVKEEPKVLITEKEYKELIAESNQFKALEQEGVDNWDWYGEAMDMLDDDYNFIEE